MPVRPKHIKNLALILFVVLCISIVQAASLQGSASIQTTGEINYLSFKVGIYVSSWNFDEYKASTIANTFDMSQSWCMIEYPPSYDYSTKMNQVHALNPNYKFLAYRNFECVYSSWSGEWNYCKSQGWLLKDINGNYVTESDWPKANYVVDITNQSYQRWLGAKVELWLTQYPSFDGVMADNSLRYSAQEFAEMCNATPIDPNTGSYFTDQEIWDGCAGMLNAVIDAVGSNKLVVANGIWSGFVWNSSDGNGYRYILSKVPRLNGVMSEGCFKSYSDKWYSETDWLSSVNFVSWIQDNFLATGKYFDIACQASTLPSGATAKQVMMYGFCSVLLSAKYSSPRNLVDFNIDFWNLTEYPTELQLAQRLRNLEMVEPSNDYYRISSMSVYARDFVKGKVLINPSSIDYTVSLNGTYTDFYDNTVVTSSILMHAHTGVILLN
jgi:hypothetical protein